MKPYKWHMLVCTGPRCTQDGESEALFSSLGEKLKAHGLDADEIRVKRTRCSCFAICQGGPIVVVHPDGTWYERVTDEVLDRILSEHLKQGQVVEDHLFHQA
ncbi:MAG TPA: NAD(P)H-dependent oxidoreductase subunit E [Pirellulales bacterium]|nr:NAD(P)H-dependent oxidoreductase subunit E [Pirellulales bacterium]